MADDGINYSANHNAARQEFRGWRRIGKNTQVSMPPSLNRSTPSSTSLLLSLPSRFFVALCFFLILSTVLPAVPKRILSCINSKPYSSICTEGFQRPYPKAHRNKRKPSPDLQATNQKACANEQLCTWVQVESGPGGDHNLSP